MNNKRALNAEKWLVIVERFKKSGDTLTGYSKKIGVNKYTLSYWVKKFAENKESAQKKGFVQLQGMSIQSVNRLYVRFRTGTELDLPADYNLNNLIELVNS